MSLTNLNVLKELGGQFIGFLLAESFNQNSSNLISQDVYRSEDVIVESVNQKYYKYKESA